MIPPVGWSPKQVASQAVARRRASVAGEAALDLFNGLVASIQTGFGPFIAVYLASVSWTQGQIGAALSIGTVVAMISQVPAGAVVDAVPNKRIAAAAACAAVAGAAVLLVLVPTRPGVWSAEVLHGFASCVIGPAIAAISLRMVGRGGLGERLGRNARYAAIGSAVAAVIMGAIGNWDEEAVFWFTAGLMLPALLSLYWIRRGTPMPVDRPVPARQTWRLALDPRLLLFAGCFALFQLGNAAVLPLVGAHLTRTVGSQASLVIAACITVPQLLVALISPAVGRAAEKWGRKPLFIVALAVMPVRVTLLAYVQSPWLVVAVQALDGFSAAGMGVLLPLVAADLTHGTNRFNLCMGLLGLAAGLGATFSTGLAGFAADQWGAPTALLGLAGSGVLATALAFAVGDTREVSPPVGHGRLAGVQARPARS